MVYGVYSIRDVKTTFMTPVVDVNDSAAVRNFFHTVQTAEGVLFSHAQDFTFYKIGEFDVDSGALTPVVPVVYLASASDAVAALGGKENG